MAESKTPSLLKTVTGSPQTERLVSALQSYATAQLQHAAMNAGRRLGETTSRLNDAAEGRGPGLGQLLPSGGSLGKAALKAGAGKVKDGVLGKLGALTGGGKRSAKGGSRPTTIVEQVDVGVPVREAYDQWTQYDEFSRFAKGVKSASATGDTGSDWQAKIFISSRSWKSTTTEQIPDERIVWSSEGAKGTTKGVVTFHELAPALTRVLLIVEYYPRGLFEKTGNIWRAQGRRVRLDLKHFARHLSMQGEASGGWRGEIRDGELVRSHEEVAEAEAAEDEAAYADEEPPEEDEYEEDAEDRAEAGDGAYEDEAEEEYEYEDERAAR
ncbi:SRPBCC family protein [Streptomyces sp. WMMC500]|uniref:SRPBCC family protein n=1 Tax=Streptomyces sp. WMMC500 TaxID=3015154 RepID=UPI00248C1369|nr:SRPBCC family protein [Streptomyces sp. WMMC500]WBB62909.1 SRPBCC family protein [Streptomyces sp. WMMC500]